MTVQALAGLASLNALYLLCGAMLLWAIRGLDTWTDVLRLAGLAYIVGIVVTGVTWTLLLIVGVPFSLALVLAVPLVLTAASGIVGARRGRALPRGGRFESGSSLVVTAVGIAATGVLLQGLFRSARLSGLYAWDAWSFWIPKAKAIYYFGELDEGFFTSLPGASYPLLMPTLDAAAFHVMGSPEVVTLHVQYWLFGVGFVWALAGLLAERVPAWILWPFVLLGLVAPRIGRRFSITEADLFLDFLFVLAALLVVAWIADRARWRLVVATLLLCGMVSTKREGLLLGALLLAAALLASARRWRTTWPALGAAAAVVAAVAVPWRVWYVVHDVAGEGPARGFLQADNLEWLWPSVRRALDVQWDTGYWNLIVPLAVGSLIVAALARADVLVAFFGSLLVLVTLGGVWATWTFSKPWETGELGGNFIIRFMGSAALLSTAAAPMLLSASWRAATGSREPPQDGKRHLALATAIVVVPLLGYPLVALAGGAPRFPSRDECVHPTAEGQPVDVVYGRFDDPAEATDFRDRVLAVGFAGTEALPDGCGRWEVVLEGVPTLEVARGVQAEARSVDLSPTLELGSAS